MSNVILPPSSPLLPGGDFGFSRNRRSLKYAVQIRDEHQRRTIKCITVSVDVSGGLPPPAIKQQLTRKVINFVSNAYPGQLQMKAIVVGRIDIEI